jgi:uncharacterized protein (TIGR02246 family)
LSSADAAGEVETAEQAWAKAVVENDLAALETLLADDLYYSHSNFAVDTKRSYIDALKSGKARYYAIDLDSTEVRLVDDRTALAMSVGHYETRAADGSRQAATLKTLHVFRKNDGRWQLIAHQSARKP